MGSSTLTKYGPIHIMQQHLHDGPIWALPKILAYLHVDSTNYFKQYMLHGLGLLQSLGLDL
jgi:hypothetical protein